jgi:uncharacterized protein YecE (DUF72 family)
VINVCRTLSNIDEEYGFVLILENVSKDLTFSKVFLILWICLFKGTLATVRLGTSGWSYDEWVDVFYPSKDIGKLSYYANLFETAEINSTFYVYPNPRTILGWLRHTPGDFKFAAKLPQLITHNKKLSMKEDVEDDLHKFLDLLRPVIDTGKLGAVLIQLPPSFNSKSVDRLQEFFAALPDEIRFAVEFRHKSWVSNKTLKLLEKYRVAYTIVDEILLPPDPIVTTDFAFFRWHGRNPKFWYNYTYSKKELKPWISKLMKVSDQVKEVYGYFNNHPKGQAVRNLLDMNEMLGRLTPEQAAVKWRVEGVLDGKLGQTKLF